MRKAVRESINYNNTSIVCKGFEMGEQYAGKSPQENHR